jgi:alanyl-tRNA synthetase
MSEMDEIQQVETAETIQQPAGETPAAAGQDDIELMKAALKKANNEAAKYRKQADALAAEQKAKADAEMSEMDKLKRELAEVQAKATQAERQNLQRKIGAELGLPDVLALRLQGDDEDAMREDAKAILATMPKKSNAPTLSATNPGNGQSPGETLAQQRQRVYGGGADIFSPGEAAKLGGGVVFKDSA